LAAVISEEKKILAKHLIQIFYSQSCCNHQDKVIDVTAVQLISHLFKRWQYLLKLLQ
jgi:hypothetical protein